MQTIQAATYPIHFQQKGYQNLEKLLTQKKYSTLFILVDENTKQLCYPRFLKHLNTLLSIKIIEIKSGEIHKNLETCVTVWNKITDFGGDRKSLLITLGGGVITDLGGFVASCFKRGIDFINIPTTLLSMVDASVGGKTGVDLGVLKNQIGVFANPQMVIIDEGYLETLATRELTSGMAEIIKHGLIYDAKLFNQIKVFKEQNTNSLIHRSIEIKNEVVLQDPKEKNLRKILN
ncbi:MAG: 3-dehydroquinate synthase, partial [Flavobacteriaceae bacterium CG_4_8_14_3_um_filter_31_8]